MTIKPLTRARYDRRRTTGDCYAYTWREALAWLDAGRPEPALRVCHGDVRLGLGGAMHHHAWIERGDFAYDWQTIVVRRGEPLPIGTFYEQQAPRNVRMFAAERLSKLLLRHGHYGPWSAEEG